MSCCNPAPNNAVINSSVFNGNTRENPYTEECIIAHKIFDQCRRQICLTPDILGPARNARDCSPCGECCNEGDIIVPPSNAASVCLSDLELSRVLITNKKPSPFKTGYWDVEVKFIFTYTLSFRDSECNLITCRRATSIYTMNVTLFGSIGSETAMATDLINAENLSTSSGPFISVEAKAASLAAEIKLTAKNCCDNGCGCNNNCGCNNSCGCSNNCDCGCNNGCGNGYYYNDSVVEVPTSVCVTIGLFVIIRIFRPVNMIVKSYGCCIPDECAGNEKAGAANVCDFFNSLSFPTDMFCPPTLDELDSNVSIPEPKSNCN